MRFLEIQIFHAQCIVLDELAPWFDDIAHQLGKEIIGFGDIFNFHLQ